MNVVEVMDRGPVCGGRVVASRGAGGTRWRDWRRSVARVLTCSGMMVVSLVMTVRAAEPGVNVNQVVTDGLTSTKDHGVVKVQSDPTLAQGRLVLKIVAFNRTNVPSRFGPDDVKVFTAAGQTVPLMTLDQLVEETRGSSGGSRTTTDTFGTSGPTITHDAAGRPDVGNFTGGSSSMGASYSTRTKRPDSSKADDPKVQQQIATLSAAILQPSPVAPSATVGGQVVTQKIKFGRKEERALRVVVELNGEQHAFEFAAPGEK